ncbi:hypothetical protein LTR95_017640 [Oleoguttula sp. CCFEE 5521]
MAAAVGDVEEGAIESFNTKASEGLVNVLLEEESYPRGLRALNSTLFRLTLGQLRKILEKHKNVMVVNVTVELEDVATFKQALLKVLGGCASLEQAEIVVAPAESLMEKPPKEIFEHILPSQGDLDALSSKCSKLASLKANVFRDPRLGVVEWERKNGVWSSDGGEPVSRP